MSMKGIYIPDVSLPGDGDFELWIAIKKDGSFTYNVSGGWRNGKQKAVSVPPHGRLIDADALKQNTYEIYDPMGIIEAVPVDVIDNAQTVIEAEDGKT